MNTERAAPRDCPVCGGRLALTRLSCRSCGTELSGNFESCEFCALNSEDRQLLKIFLASRGNMKDVERQLAVSYPTARARVDALLARLGLGEKQVKTDPRVATLEALARGEIDLDEAERRL